MIANTKNSDGVFAKSRVFAFYLPLNKRTSFPSAVDTHWLGAAQSLYSMVGRRGGRRVVFSTTQGEALSTQKCFRLLFFFSLLGACTIRIGPLDENTAPGDSPGVPEPDQGSEIPLDAAQQARQQEVDRYIAEVVYQGATALIHLGPPWDSSFLFMGGPGSNNPECIWP
jgi:hypothetical protein